MNIRLIIGTLTTLIALELVGILYQTIQYKKAVEESIKYEEFRKDVLIKASKERNKVREALQKQKELQNKMDELNSKRKKNLAKN